MNRCKMQSKMLDIQRAGLADSLVQIRRSMVYARNKERFEKLKDLLSPSSLRKYWNKFVGVQLKEGKQTRR